MLGQVSLHQGDRVLDVACGTGIVTRLVVQRFPNIASIVGMDLNPGMLEVARANTPTTGVPVEWQQGDLCALPFPEDHCDVVLCNQGMQFVPDKSVALGESKRVLVSGGQLVFTVWSEVPPYFAALAEALGRHVSAEVEKSCLSPFMFRNAETIRKLVDDAGFRAIEMQEMAFTRRHPASVNRVLEAIAPRPYARDVEAVSEETRMQIGQEVCAALQAYREGDDFVEPVKSHLVQARAA
jgi:ubiquinone/menaquinone biosynthesis C-methylase UbiE